ncbi:MAG: UDP-glucose 4-epimerase GalE [Bacteroidales bacterium]|jgi:UDP-glucose 4-epimerase|nr:UDP-glucose 4-epimerase GalE [Bacteroidales bacterium]
MKILVTGGTGYIGSHTVVELLNENFEVVIADNLSNSNAEVVDKIEEITAKKVHFEKTDLSCPTATAELFQKHGGFDGVIHFAAFKAVGESVKEPLKYYHNNIFSLINLMNEMEKYKTQFLVFSSSCTVYGQPEELPVTENAAIQKALSPYGNTKQIAEEIITDYCLSNPNFNAILLRYFNPIGAHPSAKIGELPIGVPQNLIPYITQTAIGKREKLSVFGNDYSTPDGTCIRDYIHVVDLAQAHLAAMRRIAEQKNEENIETFNIGTGNGFSVLEIINSFEKVSNQKLPYEFAPRREGDIEKVWANTTLANEKLKWKAKLSLDEMLLSAWNWEKNINKNNE